VIGDFWNSAKWGRMRKLTYNATTDTVFRFRPPTSRRTAVMVIRSSTDIRFQLGTASSVTTTAATRFYPRGLWPMVIEEADGTVWAAVKGVTTGGTLEITLVSDTDDWELEIYPLAAFSAASTTGNAPFNVVFTDASENAVSWAWDFGDGTTSTSQSPTHSYANTGTYTVSLTVTSEIGDHTDIETKTGYITVNAIVADFTGTPVSGAAPLSVTFTDTSTGAPTVWAWDFGDGGTSTSQNPTYSYAAAGTYTVTLVASGHGSTDTEVKTSYITAVDPIPVYVQADSQYWINEDEPTLSLGGVTSGNLIIGVILHTDSRTITISGWTLAYSWYFGGSTNWYGAIYTQAAAATSVQFSPIFNSNATHVRSAIIEIANASTATPIDTYAVSYLASGTSNSLASGLTTTEDNCLMVGFTFTVDTDGFCVPSAWTNGCTSVFTQQKKRTGTHDWYSCSSVNTKDLDDAGATGAFAITISASGGSGMVGMAINSAYV
jgi:PKD repeat protein